MAKQARRPARNVDSATGSNRRLLRHLRRLHARASPAAKRRRQKLLRDGNPERASVSMASEPSEEDIRVARVPAATSSAAAATACDFEDWLGGEARARVSKK